MRLKVLLVFFALVLAAAGSLLSYFGYTQSLQLRPTVEGYRATSQEILTSVESRVVTTTSEMMVINEVLEFPEMRMNWRTGNCPEPIKYNRTLLEGQLHITYSSRRTAYPPGSSAKPPTDFWLQSPIRGPPKPMNLATACNSGISYGYDVIFNKMSASDFDGIVEVPETGEYQFVFIVHDIENPLSFSIKAEQQLTTVTTVSQTWTSSFDVTYETSSTSFHPVGLGSPFYAGLGLLFATATVIVVYGLAHRKPRGRPPASACLTSLTSTRIRSSPRHS